MYRYIIAAILCFTSFVSAQDTVNESWDKALKLYEDAEKKIRKGSNDEAVVILKTAVDALKEIQYNYPKWNPSIVRNKLLAAKKRIDDVEKLILSSLTGLNREQLLDKLKETQIAKAKFSKAMMIIYNQLKDTQELLKLKSADLEKAQKAASKKITDQAHLDKLTFENLKMKKSLAEKEAQIKILQAGLDKKNKDQGAVKLQKEYELKLILLSKKSKELENDKKDYLAEKAKLAESLKEMSLKYKEVTQKEDLYEKSIDTLNKEITSLKKLLAEEEAMKKKVIASSKNVTDKLELAAVRLTQLEKREKKLVEDLANLKKGKEISRKMAKNDEIAKLNKQVNDLKKIEIDLKSKLDASQAESIKNKQLLQSYMAESGPDRKKSRQLEEQLTALKKTIAKNKTESNIKNNQMISMSSEISSLKGQLKLQKTIINSLRDKLKNNTAPVMKVEEKESPSDPKLLKAYEKNEKELVEKLKLAEQELRKLRKRNETLKKENLLGDEEMIRKYVQVRDELKAYKAKTREIYSKIQKEGSQKGVMEAAFSEDEKKEIARQEKLRDLLFRAQKSEKEENFQAALGLYTDVLQIEPENYAALFRIGLLHYNRRHYQDAVVHLKKAFYQEPDDENLLLAIGLSYLEQDKLELAVSYLSRLVGLKPEDALSRLQLGVSLQGLGWTEAAFDQLKKACELDKSNGEAAFNLAMVSLALPEPQVKFARENYERAVKLGIVRDPQLEKYFQQYKDN